jgi:hypothetical protein
MDDLRKQIYALAYQVRTYPNDFDIVLNEKGVEQLLALIASYSREAYKKGFDEGRIQQALRDAGQGGAINAGGK